MTSLRSCVASLFLVGLLGLAACAGPGRGRADIAVYDLGPPPAVIAGAAEAHAGVTLELRLPFWLDAQTMTYRLAYAEPQRVREYAQARWVGPPGPMLQARLRQRLGMTAAGAPCTLRVELDDFSQSFSGPEQSQARVSGVALLLDTGRREIARQPILIEVAATTADAPGGVAALAAAVDVLSGALAPWLQKQPLAACRRPA